MKQLKDFVIIIFILCLSVLFFSCSKKITEPEETKVAKPTFKPRTGAYEQPQEVTINCSTKGVTIRYTTDRSMPNSSSPIYSSPVLVDSKTTIIAQAYKEGLKNSDTTSESYTFIIAKPVFNLKEGNYNTPQSVTISCATEGAEVRYTTDGETPTHFSTLYEEPIQIVSSLKLRARAFKTGWTNSEVANVSYDVVVPTVATPIISPKGGIVDFPLSITISCATEGAKIYYTADNSIPTSSSTLYTAPIHIASDTVIKAKAFKENWLDSDLASDVYTLRINEMIYVPGGTFTMGRTKGTGSNNELPAHSVTLNSFYIGKCQVTQAEFQAIMGNNPVYDWASQNPDFNYSVGNNYPVYYINWYHAIKYCNLRSMNEGLTPVYSIAGSNNPNDWGEVPFWYEDDSIWATAICNWHANGYRLPTEAEWEYAARGATNNPDYLFSGSDNVDSVAWYSENSDGTSHPVAEKVANGLKLFDMSGNVREWCWDFYDDHYYSFSPQSNPTGPARGFERVYRGGSWLDLELHCRLYSRGGFNPALYILPTGFRVCRSSN